MPELTKTKTATRKNRPIERVVLKDESVQKAKFGYLYVNRNLPIVHIELPSQFEPDFRPIIVSARTRKLARVRCHPGESFLGGQGERLVDGTEMYYATGDGWAVFKAEHYHG